MLVLCLKVTRFKTMISHLTALVLKFLFYIKEALGQGYCFLYFGTLGDIHGLSNAWISKK